MFVVTNDGKKLPVDDSAIDFEKDYVPFQQTVGLYTDDTILKPVWYLTLYRTAKATLDSFYTRKAEQLEFVAEVYFDHKPTQEEILWAMSAHGLSRYDFATICEGYELDME